ncbi:MAG TPA: SurA N-terminal domain-containing protein [Burkholderiales bacterium]|nr:SurA N-terminal domain-containing protein [Burkholderiales bacterium]HYA45975.1 SurA N-terminal domain-containing protein [Burkholderiales bacterium]
MFDFVSKHKRLLQIILGLMIVPPFAFWGIQWTQRVGGAGEVAEVGGQKIGEQEFSEALRQQQDRLQGTLGKNFDPAMFDSPAMRREVLDGMISQRLLTQYAARNYLTVSDDTLVETTMSIPAFQVDGRFSRERYDIALQNERMSPEAFDAALRRDLVVQQISSALADSAFASKASADQFALLRAQQREISEQKIQADPRGVQISADAVRAFYDANPARFQVPEEVQVEYVVLSADSLLATEQVDPGEAKKYYEANLSKYGEPEQRRASHILISVKPGASEEDKRKARERAESVLAKLRASPGSFADLAKKESGDPGSASQGGDLGFFSRGMMVRPFEDAAFSLKPGQISGIVESDFGFHIIKVTAVKPGKMRTFEEVRPEIELMLKKQQAQRHFAEAAEAFSNIVYEQADSLKPAAEKFHLVIQKAQGITRQAASVPALNNPRLLGAIFSEDSIKNRRNTEAVETSPGTLVSARVLDHKAASLRPFDEVRDGIAKELARQEALARARRQGAALLEELRKGDASKASFGASRLVSRDDPKGLAPAAISHVFAVDAAKLPAYAGLESADGYTLYRVSRVVDVQPDEARQRSVQSELGRMNGALEFRSFLDGLRADAKVEINREALERKAQ